MTADHSFLLRSHRAVLRHCDAVLAGGGLSREQEEKLNHLSQEASAELGRLAASENVDR
jgi:hypothetical protein